ncbi:MAG: hypothetical protein OXE81_01150 [Gammaproteobacteria bacterium]|nr:hypothetical protein [Gammaproteobacteria bacterium]
MSNVSLGVSIGASIAPDMRIQSRSNDRASICDEYINPRALAIPDCVTTNRGVGDGWLAPFDDGIGVSMDLEARYAFREDLGLSLVYAFDSIDFDETVSSTDASGADFDKISNELAVGEESLGTSNAHSLFLTGYKRWPNRTAWTPYAGLGVGLSWQRMDFSWNWARSADPSDIATGLGEPNEAEIRRNLAGTVSSGRAALKDRMTAYVAYAGIEREFREHLNAGVKVQWRTTESFDSGEYGADILRSHAPNLRRDGSEPVSTWSETHDTDRFSVMLTLRYEL